jgi:hypothetical protein
MVVGAVFDWQEVDDVREFARSLGPEVTQPVQQLHPHQLGLYQSAPLQVVDVRVRRAQAATNLPPHGRARAACTERRRGWTTLRQLLDLRRHCWPRRGFLFQHEETSHSRKPIRASCEQKPVGR